MLKQLKRFEKLIVSSLIIMMFLVLFLATIELGWIIIKDIITPPIVLLEINELLEIFGLFLLVLIGIELLEMIKVYIEQNVVHVEVCFTVALIAITRKIVILDIEKYSPLTLIGVGIIIIALSVGYFFIKQIHRKEAGAKPSSENH